MCVCVLLFIQNDIFSPRFFFLSVRHFGMSAGIHRLMDRFDFFFCPLIVRERRTIERVYHRQRPETTGRRLWKQNSRTTYVV